MTFTPPSNNRPADPESSRCPHSIMLGEPGPDGRRVHYRCDLPLRKHTGEHDEHLVDIPVGDWNRDAKSSVDIEKRATAQIRWKIDFIQPKPPKSETYSEHHIRKGDQQVEDIVYGDNRGNY